MSINVYIPVKPVAYVLEKGRKPRPVYTTFLADLMRDAGMEVVEA